MLCYDISNYQSFQDLEDWYRLVQRTFQGQPMPRVTLIGNKTDLNHIRTVKVEKHNLFADENDMCAAAPASCVPAYAPRVCTCHFNMYTHTSHPAPRRPTEQGPRGDALLVHGGRCRHPRASEPPLS